MRDRSVVAIRGLLLPAIPAVLVACAQIDSSLTDLEVGDCVRQPAVGDLGSLDHVECEGFGILRVVSVFDVKGYDDYPGDETIDRVASSRCPVQTAYVLAPTEDSWEKAGDRKIVCFDRPVPTQG